ncbi:MAG: hypothetical protein H7336_10920 [Bacteriovorax sp.]|nr:hypothetical protein [Bacteriovorax sp.]
MFNLFRSFLIIILSTLLINQSMAQQIPVAEMSAADVVAMEKEFKMQADFIKLMLQVGEQIDHETQNDKDLFNKPEKLSGLLQEKILIYHEFFEKNLQIPNEKKSIFKKAVLAMQWDNIIPLMKKSRVGMEVFFKKKGPGFAAAFILGDVFKVVIPMILTNIGLAYLATIVALFPFTVAFSFIPSYISKIQLKKVLIQELGGKIQFEAYQKQEDAVFKNMHMKDPTDFIFPIKEEEGVVEGLLLKKETWKNYFYSKLGFNKKSLNFQSMQKFLTANSISDPYLDWILSEEKMDKTMKTFMITNHLFALKDISIKEKFQLQFSESILTLKGNPNWKEVWVWTKEMMEVKSIEEAMTKINEAPNSLHPKEVAIIWENFLLPEYTQKFDLSYSEGRLMNTSFGVLKAKLNMSPSDSLNERIKNDIFTYFKKIVEGKKFGGCQNSSLQINKFLLGKAL